MKFLDTNVLLYSISRDPGEQYKADIATKLLQHRELSVSTQVLQEFYVQATRDSRPDKITHEQASSLIRSFTRFHVHPVNTAVVELALAFKDRYEVSYWDAAIIAAATLAGCSQVLSEDLNHGHEYGSVQVIDPFQLTDNP